MENGWISLHRKIQENEFYPQNRPFTKFEAWIDLLLNANHSDKEINVGNQLFICKRGELMRSLETLSKRWNWSKPRVRRVLLLLKKRNMIELKSEQKSTRITICNYDNYQGERNASETQVKRKRYPNNNNNNVNKKSEDEILKKRKKITNDTI